MTGPCVPHAFGRIASSVQKALLLLELKNYIELTYNPFTMSQMGDEAAEALVRSSDPEHPANHICTLCAKFYNLGWVQFTFMAATTMPRIV